MWHVKALFVPFDKLFFKGGINAISMPLNGGEQPWTEYNFHKPNSGLRPIHNDADADQCDKRSDDVEIIRWYLVYLPAPQHCHDNEDPSVCCTPWFFWGTCTNGEVKSIAWSSIFYSKINLAARVLSNPPDKRPTALIFVFDLMFVTATHIWIG